MQSGHAPPIYSVVTQEGVRQFCLLDPCFVVDVSNGQNGYGNINTSCTKISYLLLDGYLSLANTYLSSPYPYHTTVRSFPSDLELKSKECITSADSYMIWNGLGRVQYTVAIRSCVDMEWDLFVCYLQLAFGPRAERTWFVQHCVHSSTESVISQYEEKEENANHNLFSSSAKSFPSKINSHHLSSYTSCTSSGEQRSSRWRVAVCDCMQLVLNLQIMVVAILFLLQQQANMTYLLDSD